MVNRGSRGGRHGRHGRQSRQGQAQQAQDASADLDFDANPSAFFLGVASVDSHALAQSQSRSRYAAAVGVLVRDGVEINQNAKARALAAAWSRHDRELADSLLAMRDTFGIVEVLKAVQLLDSARKMREWQKKLAKVEAELGRKHPKLEKKVKMNVSNLSVNKPGRGSASGAVCRHVKRWVRGHSAAELEFFALHLSKEPWKKLADICHFNPEKDFPNLPWFLPFCFGQEAPHGSLAARSDRITAENVNEVVLGEALPFSDVRRFKDDLTDEAKAAVVRNDDKVDRGIWWYEDLQCEAVDEAIERRLRSGEEVTLTYGKLMERLLLFSSMPKMPSFLPLLMPLAEQKLQATSLFLEAPVVVIGDASSSMHVAIKTATIISSLLTAIIKSDLVFFNDDFWRPASNPRTIADVLELAKETRASGCTAHAAALWPFYESKTLVKTFIVVTDEEENTSYRRHRFFDLFDLYRREVYNSKLVFVSFLRHQHAQGQMMREAEQRQLRVQQFVLQGDRPDLNKLDTILGRLGADSSGFADEVSQLTERIDSEGVGDVFGRIFGDRTAVQMQE